jgi:hypothetical protein
MPSIDESYPRFVVLKFQICFQNDELVRQMTNMFMRNTFVNMTKLCYSSGWWADKPGMWPDVFFIYGGFASHIYQFTGNWVCRAGPADVSCRIFIHLDTWCNLWPYLFDTWCNLWSHLFVILLIISYILLFVYTVSCCTCTSSHLEILYVSVMVDSHNAFGAASTIGPILSIKKKLKIKNLSCTLQPCETLSSPLSSVQIRMQFKSDSVAAFVQLEMFKCHKESLWSSRKH